MVVVETSLKTLRNIVGKEVKDLEDVLFRMGMEVEVREGNVRAEITAERVDMLTPEGLGRALKAYLGLGANEYKVKGSGFSVLVDKSVKDVRPFTACCIVSGLEWTPEMIKETMASHEKINKNYGRNRKKAAIGVYPLSKVRPPIRYYTEAPEKISFVPLGSEKEMDAKEILREHPKGREYGRLLEGHKRYPVFVDSAGTMMSMPPVINSSNVGEVREGESRVFIEVSGWHKPTVNSVLNVVSSSLAERGGIIETMEIVYPEGKEVTPDLNWRKMNIEKDYVNSVFGLDIDSSEIAKLLERMLYRARVVGDRIDVEVPPYRADVLHPLDVADDAGRAYGFDRMEPVFPKVPTIGSVLDITRAMRKVSGMMTGLGFQEAMTNVLTGRESQFSRMGIKEEGCIELLEAKEGGINIARRWVLPELLKFLSNNLHRPFPQMVFETGDIVSLGESDTGARDSKNLAAIISDSRAGYEDISSSLVWLLNSLGLKFSLSPKEHPSFIGGRCASIIIDGRESGVVGEIHPQVLEKWGIENPCAAFELEIERILLGDKSIR